MNMTISKFNKTRSQHALRKFTLNDLCVILYLEWKREVHAVTGNPFSLYLGQFTIWMFCSY